MIDFAVDSLQYIGRELGRHVAKRPVDLVRCLPEDFTEFLCAAGAAFRV